MIYILYILIYIQYRGDYMSKLYTLEELTYNIIDEFKLDCSGTDAFHNYYQRIYRALDNQGFLKKGIEKINPKTNRKCRFYTEQQKQVILAEKTLFNYVRTNSASEQIKNGKKYDEIQDDIEKRRDAFINMMDNLADNSPDEDVPYISNKEFQNYKNSMMLTALFEKFFTPINDELLINDMTQVFIIRDEASLDVADIEAEQRLAHPEGNYYKSLSK